ncbi:conserved Plasmodium protein, unknown function [Plasmodium knowlesi strain H]|uniref:Macro domain-containing protein n=3 Tax=Plasmodium knowlesi TaxID=5850 RepID=A0A5K1V0V4_PLAKH|nr:conserved Plasmodium protein, unknown function [Plasmodium knowlesi strain H]OTN68407.1 Uncharacterized protein PKNOH_S02304400 [Plasmodium knowlesi]CAA9986545.1 conserved Plasmodium protein, unknown function [Plasmodium knowlesi strain H]SBO24188.1 conserved Plasmodium protein, unknown function [Plasmodium knowlesi strain H]SBO29791.1 conserved Plasmodium protein, unknown function [Plasmodium knowlesi strain H]VVS76019.1 conserved Plasmodium protein, unknown function [Plasmodium knowlesi s|eukprot:XP_002261094.1 hypothetical protein, conserved in Plasmodium species [Plasmodium knowlesi strain H]
MSVGDKLNEAFCWLKEEFDELITDLEVDKSELNVSDIYTKINNTFRSINGGENPPLCADDKGAGNNKKTKERINHEELVPWSNLNYSLFHYVHIYNKIRETLLIDDEDFCFNFDTENFFSKRRFSPNLAFHPLISSIEVSYFNFLLFCILGGSYDKLRDGASKEEDPSGDNPNEEIVAPSSRRRGNRAEITYVYNDDLAYKENFIVTKEDYAALSEVYTKIPSLQRCLERGEDALFNFGPRTGETSTNKASENNGDGKNEIATNDDSLSGGCSAATLTREELNETYAFSLKKKTYMVHPQMNNKITFFNGDISAVDTDAIVLFANHNYRFTKTMCENLYSSTLMKLEDEDKMEIKCKKSGEVYLTNSYDGIHKYVLHVMLPKYSSKYILATHNTMNVCIQEILCICVDKRIQSISIPIVCFGLFFPINIFLVSFLKSLRSLFLLPQFYNAIRSVVLVTNSNDLYLLALKYGSIFFPRCREEMFLSANIAILGNKLGSIDVRNRGIRIFRTLRRITRGGRVHRRRRKMGEIANAKWHPTEKDTSANTLNRAENGSSAWPKSYSSSSSSINSSSSVASSASSRSSTSPASSDIFKETDTDFLSLKTESEGHTNLYKLHDINKREDNMMANLEFCLRLSSMYNIKNKYSEFEKDSFLYEYGIDKHGRKTMVVNFFRFPQTYNYHLLFLYILFHFNSFMRNHFVLLFIFSESIATQITNVLSLFKDIFQLVTDFLHNLKVIYFFNYSLAFKLFIYVLYPFIPENIYNNIVYLNDGQELSKYFDVKKALRQ